MSPSVDIFSDSMKNLTLEQIRDLLETGQLDEFVGCRENLFLEAKQVAAFDMNAGRSTNIKLSKYAASFANQKGGYILCGLETERPEASSQDIVRHIKKFEKATFYPPESIIGRIAESTYPKIRAEVRWYPTAQDASLGVGAIYIPPQNESKKYFHIEVTELDGEKLKGEWFGVPIRDDGFTTWLSVSELYQKSKAGPNSFRDLQEWMSGEFEELRTLMNGENHSPDELQNKIDLP